MGQTCLGKTIKLTFDDEATHYAMFFAASDSYLYSVTTAASDNAIEDPVAIAEDILANGKLR